MDVAPTWSRFANIQFQFVQAEPSEIRVAFNSVGGNWSAVGTDAGSIAADDTTLNLQEWWNSGTVLHEFGHVLGMIHEQSHPESGIQWNRDAVYAYYEGPPNHWTREQIDNNIFYVASRAQTNFSQYDPASIMQYPIDPAFTTNGFSVPWNNALSSKDRCFVGELYPGPGITEFAISGSGVRGGEGWYVGDFNGDGRADILRYLNENGGAEVALSTGSGFRSPVQWSGAGVRGGRGWYVGDFNGDGKDDILRYLNANGGAEVALSTGSGFRSPVLWSGQGERGGDGWYVGDYNGDGKGDVVRYATSDAGGGQVLLSSSSSFGSAVTWSNHRVEGGRGWYVGDWDGDGADDLLRYLNESGGAVVYLSGGDCFPSFLE